MSVFVCFWKSYFVLVCFGVLKNNSNTDDLFLFLYVFAIFFSLIIIVEG